MIKLGQRGDTIIEVLLAITILSAVIAGAYATTSQATRIGLTAHERTEATRLSEQQIEIVKALYSVDTENYVDLRNRINAPPAGQELCLTIEDITGDTSNREIVVNSANPLPAACANYNGSRYRVEFSYIGNATYQSRVTWEGTGSEGDQNATIIYRIRP